MAFSENKQRSLRGELYHAFTPELLKDRARCARALRVFNNCEDESRRKQIELWRNIIGDTTPLPPRKEGSTDDEDDTLFEDECCVLAPFRADNGANIRVGKGTFINAGCTMIDTCLIEIGQRVLFGPNVSLYSGSHPTDPYLRNGFQGPEDGAEIHIGDDCWIGGMVVVVAGVNIGKGCTIGASSVVTRNIPDFSIAVGSPARVIKQTPLNSISEEERQRIYDIAMKE